MNIRKIFLAGDSRSSRDYTFYGEILHQKTGAEIVVGGWSGSSCAAQASDRYFTRFDGSEDIVFWWTGGNDVGDVVGTFDKEDAVLKNEPPASETDITENYNGTLFIQAVDHMMRRFKALDFGSKKALLVFTSDLPQQRFNKDNPFSKEENWLKKCAAIRQCCKKNNVPYLDLYTYCQFDMSKEPFWVPPTDMIHNNGYRYMDGLHPNPSGIDKITDAEVEFIKKLR